MAIVVVYLSFCLSASLKTNLFCKASSVFQKRSKFCKTSSTFESDNIKNETSQRDFLEVDNIKNETSQRDFLEVDNIKTETSQRDFLEVDNIKCEASLRDFPEFSKVATSKRSNPVRLPSKMEIWVQNWRPRANAFCDFITPCV